MIACKIMQAIFWRDPLKASGRAIRFNLPLKAAGGFSLLLLTLNATNMSKQVDTLAELILKSLLI